MVMEPHVPPSWAHWTERMEGQDRGLGRQTAQKRWTRKGPASKSNTRNGRDLCVATLP